MEYGSEENNIESNNLNNHNEVNEIVENKHNFEDPKILLNEDTLKINKMNLGDNDEKNNIFTSDKNNQEYNDINENISLINIDMEKEKNNQIQEENKNKINIEKDQENEEEEEDQENTNIDGYLYKCNKEYTDNDNDLHSRRITVKNNNDDYLMAQDENNPNQKDVLGDYKNDENEKDEEEEELFPFKIIGDGKKKVKH